MKFRFCGDADCPDWVLVEMNTLSRLSSVKLKLLAQVVAQGIINPPIDMKKIDTVFTDSKLDSDISLPACVACISYILSVATRYSCDSSVFQSELQQLGLPREHSTSLKRVLDDQIAKLTEKFIASSLKINNLKDVITSHDSQVNCAIVEFVVENERHRVCMAPHTVDLLLKDLKNLRKTMSELTEG